LRRSVRSCKLFFARCVVAGAAQYPQVRRIIRAAQRDRDYVVYLQVILCAAKGAERLRGPQTLGDALPPSALTTGRRARVLGAAGRWRRLAADEARGEGGHPLMVGPGSWEARDTRTPCTAECTGLRGLCTESALAVVSATDTLGRNPV